MTKNSIENASKIDENIVAEASRCLNCPTAPCKKACPIGQDIPKFLSFVKNGDGKGACRSIFEVNALGGICGAVCPHEKQCQGSCVLGKKGRPLSIGKIENFIYQNFAYEFVLESNNLKGKKIAIVGSGPAGLSCAWHLAKQGATVTVFEKQSQAGGVLTYGIPSFRLNKHLVKKLIFQLQSANVEFVFNCEIGKQTSLKQLAQSFDAVFVATGLQNDYPLDIDGQHLQGVVLGNDYLKAPVKGTKVIVVGGGNVAIDCARTAVRQGAKVTVAYRRTQSQMPAYSSEILLAKDEGIEFKFLLSPLKIEGQTAVEKMQFCVNKLVESTDGGRASFEATGQSVSLDCDLVIVAIGSFLEQKLLVDSGVDIANGRVVCNQNMHSTADNIFVGGDIANRANTVVQACEDGKKASKAICTALLGN